MRYFYCTESNPRMAMLNESLKQPLLFAPASAVKALTYAAWYGAGPRPMGQMLCRG
jgi:hypothetical protein